MMLMAGLPSAGDSAKALGECELACPELPMVYDIGIEGMGLTSRGGVIHTRVITYAYVNILHFHDCL